MSDEKPTGIDETDVSQDSPAEAEAEVTDPDGREDETDTPTIAGIAQTGLATGGSTVSGRP